MIDARNPAPLWINGGWDDPVFGGEPSTYLRVNNAAFLTWMETIKVDEFSNPLWVSLEDDSTPPNQLDLLVLGVHDNIVGTSAYYDLVVRGDSLPAWVTGGVRYTLIGEKCVHNVTQSGQWAAAAIPGSSTTFTVNPNSSLTSEMAGWILQPDANVPVPIASQCAAQVRC